MQNAAESRHIFAAIQKANDHVLASEPVAHIGEVRPTQAAQPVDLVTVFAPFVVKKNLAVEGGAGDGVRQRASAGSHLCASRDGARHRDLCHGAGDHLVCLCHWRRRLCCRGVEMDRRTPGRLNVMEVEGVEITRRRLLMALSIGSGAFAAALASVPIIGFFLSPMLRKFPPVWRDVGPLEQFQIGVTCANQRRRPQIADHSLRLDSHGHFSHRRLRSRLPLSAC